METAPATRGAKAPRHQTPAATDVEREQLWGAETMKAVENFPVSGQPIPAPVVRWLGRIKATAARVNAELGLLDADIAERVAAAGDAIAEGEHDDQFPVDVFQTGSGTSSNMNANEVMANLAGGETHPNDHVNMGQSSNDVFPSAVHLAALDETTRDLLPAMDELASALERKAEEFADVVKAGRTHLMDAVPVTLGQEFGGYAAQIRLGSERIRGTLPRVGQIPLGGTATGTGLNTHSEFAERVRTKLSEASGLEISEPADPFEAQGNRDALVELSGALKVVAVSLNKIANDIALMGSGPRTGLAEIKLPALQKGSSIMPGKVNPVICEVTIQVADQVVGNDAAITMAGSQGQFELNVRVPLIARNLLDSIKLLAAACRLLDTKCVRGIEADEEMTSRHAEATLATATALNPHIGYDAAAEIVKEARESGRPLREVAREKGVSEEVLEEALDHRRMARPHD
jgi:fumarate hydratase, class II